MELRFRRAVAGLGGPCVAAGIAAYAVSGSAPAERREQFHDGRDRDPGEDQRLRLERAGLCGAVAAAKAAGLKVKLVQNIGYNNTTAVLRELAQTSGVGFIIAHASGYDTQARRSPSSTRSRS